MMLASLPLFSREFYKYIRSDVSSAIALAWIVFCLAYGILEHDRYEEQLKTALRLAYLGGFFVVGFYLSLNERHIERLLLFALFGFFLNILFHLDEFLSSGEKWWKHSYHFGFNNRGGLGLYSAAALWGAICFFQRFRPWVALILCLFLFECLLLSHSRSAWLAMAPLLLGVLVFYRKNPWAYALMGVVGLLLVLQSAEFLSRVTAESSTYETLAHGSLPNPIESPGREKSVAIRLWMYLHGLKLWLQHPILGWGPDATPALIRTTFPEEFPRFNDLHSVPVELLVRFGVVGFTLYWAMVAIVLFAGYQGYRKNLISREVYLFCIGALWIYLVFGIFGFRLRNDDWRYYWFLIAGLLTCWQARAAFPVTGKDHFRR